MDILGIIRVIALVLHIIFAGLWIGQFPVAIFFERILKQHEGKPEELSLFMTRGQILSSMGQAAGPGILLMGLVLLFTDHYALFGIGGYTPTWLFIKQV